VKLNHYKIKLLNLLGIHSGAAFITMVFLILAPKKAKTRQKRRPIKVARAMAG